MLIKLLLILLGSFSLSVLITPFLRKIAIENNLVDEPDERKIHREILPRPAGVAAIQLEVDIPCEVLGSPRDILRGSHRPDFSAVWNRYREGTEADREIGVGRVFHRRVHSSADADTGSRTRRRGYVPGVQAVIRGAGDDVRPVHAGVRAVDFDAHVFAQAC